MEVAIIVIVVFVLLLFGIIAVVRFCNKFDCCGCCDSGCVGRRVGGGWAEGGRE